MSITEQLKFVQMQTYSLDSVFTTKQHTAADVQQKATFSELQRPAVLVLMENGKNKNDLASISESITPPFYSAVI